jgi:DNA polymerase III subunit alpha
VHSLGEDGRLRARPVTDVVFNGTKQVYEIRTAQGRRIRATSTHRFKVFDGWKRLSELQIGEALATPRALPVDTGHVWPEHELITLAGLLAEGNTCHPTCLYFFNNDRALIDDFAAAATRFPRTVARIHTRTDGRRMEVCLSTGGDYRFKPGQRPWNAVDGTSALVVEDAGDRCGAFEWAASLGLLGVRATAKKVPTPVFELTDANVELFLGRLWAGDGYIAGKGHSRPFYATSSRRLAEDVQGLLLRLGIVASLLEKSFAYRGTRRPGYVVALLGDEAIRTFVDRIGPHCVGRDRALAMLRAHLGERDREWTSRDVIPTDIFWDRIVAIEPAGVEDTYDLTVETDHNFVADGFIVHNSHSISYSLITYQTAYLKANHPLEYMTALLNSKAGDFDKLKQAILDSHARGLVVRPPDVNRSGTGFVVGDPEKREILYGLSHIKNVGEKVVENLLAARDEGGPFGSLLDLCLRAGGRDLNRRVLEALVRSGACDSLGDRATLLAVIDRAMDRAAQVRREREQGQTSLFGLPSDGEGPAPLPVEDLTPVGVVPAAEEDRLRWERELLGMYLSDHPLRRIADTLRTRVDTAIGELGPHLDGLVVQVGGSVREVRTVVPRRSSTGQRMAFLQIEDMSGSCEVVVFARTFEECAALLHQDAVVVVRGKVEAQSRGDDEERSGETEPAKIIAEAVFGLDDARLLTWRRNATVHLTLGGAHVPVLGALRETLEQHPGDAPVVLHVELPEKVDQVSLAEGFGVDPGPPLERAVSALLGDGAYRVELRRERAAPRDSRRPRGRNGSTAAPPA